MLFLEFRHYLLTSCYGNGYLAVLYPTLLRLAHCHPTFPLNNTKTFHKVYQESGDILFGKLIFNIKDNIYSHLSHIEHYGCISFLTALGFSSSQSFLSSTCKTQLNVVKYRHQVIQQFHLFCAFRTLNPTSRAS